MHTKFRLRKVFEAGNKSDKMWGVAKVSINIPGKLHFHSRMINEHFGHLCLIVQYIMHKELLLKESSLKKDQFFSDLS